MVASSDCTAPGFVLAINRMRTAAISADAVTGQGRRGSLSRADSCHSRDRAGAARVDPWQTFRSLGGNGLLPALPRATPRGTLTRKLRDARVGTMVPRWGSKGNAVTADSRIPRLPPQL